MTTKAKLIFEGEDGSQIAYWKTADGYPDSVVPELRQFLELSNDRQDFLDWLEASHYERHPPIKPGRHAKTIQVEYFPVWRYSSSLESGEDFTYTVTPDGDVFLGPRLI